MLPKKTLSIVVPIYNEEQCLDELLKRLLIMQSQLATVNVEMIFVNDGSLDRSLEMMMTAAEENHSIKAINLSRNFGHQIAITAGMDYADGDFVVIIDGDLQDQPEMIPKLLAKANEGYDVVYAQRHKRKGESILKLLTARWFYQLITKICHVDILPNTGDFRLINRQVLDAFKKMREQHRFIRGMIPWLGFRSTSLYYERDKRFAGTTKYTMRKMIKFAFDALFSFSDLPLRMATYVGLSAVGLGLLGAGLMLFLRIFTPYTVPGITAVLLTIIIMSGIQIIMMGIIGEYIGRIFEEAKARPLYIIKSLINLEPGKSETIFNDLLQEKI